MNITDRSKPFYRAPRREQLFDFIQAHRDAGQPFPTPAHICAHMGWKNTSSAKDALNSLAAFDKVIDRRWVDGGMRFSYKKAEQ